MDRVNFFKDSLSQILLGTFLNTLIQMFLTVFCYVSKMSKHYPISNQCFVSIPTEKVRKLDRKLLGSVEMEHSLEMPEGSHAWLFYKLHSWTKK